MEFIAATASLLAVWALWSVSTLEAKVRRLDENLVAVLDEYNKRITTLEKKGKKA